MGSVRMRNYLKSTSQPQSNLICRPEDSPKGSRQIRLDLAKSQLRKGRKFNIPLRTASPQCSTATTHIADLRLCARITRAVGRHDARFTLILVVDSDKRVIGFHRLGHFVPIRCIKWSGGWPAAGHRIRVTSRVFELVYRSANRRVRSNPATSPPRGLR